MHLSILFGIVILINKIFDYDFLLSSKFIHKFNQKSSQNLKDKISIFDCIKNAIFKNWIKNQILKVQFNWSKNTRTNWQKVFDQISSDDSSLWNEFLERCIFSECEKRIGFFNKLLASFMSINVLHPHKLWSFTVKIVLFEQIYLNNFLWISCIG